MTPEFLEAERENVRDCIAKGVGAYWPYRLSDFLDYIDTLHEDLRLTRQERDETKKACLVYRKEVARLADALDAAEGYVARLEHERAALRRGQGTAPEPGTPEHPPFHHTHPIPDSTKGEQ